jgi:AraC-like DNA-binding protein
MTLISWEKKEMHELLLTIAVSQTFFAAVIVFLGQRGQALRPAALLGSFIFVYGASFIPEMDFVSEFNQSLPAIVPLSFFFYLFIGPSFYFYIKEITRKPSEPLITSWPLHVLPIALGVGLMSAWVFMPEDSRDIAISHELWPVNRPLSASAVAVALALIVSHVQIFSYLSASLVRLARHFSRIRDLFSNLENKTLGWARLATFAILTIWFIDLVTDIGYVVGSFGGSGEVIFTLSELLVFYFVAFFGLRQPVIFGSRGPEVAVLPPEDLVTTNKYVKSALSDAQMERISAKLDQAMTTKRLFAQSSLTLADLSREISTSQNYVSQTLNQKLGLKFYDFIAHHRVEEAKSMLAQPDNAATILEIALAVGFNSKSTFNAAFKRLVGMTPSQFRTLKA